MKASACLVNVAHGRVADEAALLETLNSSAIAGAALDRFREEPLPAASSFWSLENTIITPHTAGETRRYETNVIDILLENLGLLANGGRLVNEII